MATPKKSPKKTSSSLALLSRTARAVARGTRSGASRAASMARRGAVGARAGLVRAGAAGGRTVKRVWSASKEPLSSVAFREGVSLGGHGVAYVADAMIPFRALGGWVRPSLILTVGAFVLSAFTGGKVRLLARNAGQGGLHHYFARALDKAHDAIAPGSPSGTAGTEEGGSY